MTKFKTGIAVLMTAIICGCSSPYAATNKAYKVQAKAYAKTLRTNPQHMDSGYLPEPKWVGTTNFNMRKPNFVIIHHTAQNSCDQTLKTFTTVSTQVSAHYVICKDGSIHHMLNDYFRAWHGGIARWGNLTDINSSSIGIELDNNGFEPFTEQQISSLMTLLSRLKRNYNIPAANFIGHSDIAPGRKVDPNRNFPWKELADRGYGLWYDTVGVKVPDQFNALQALRIVGYDVKDSLSAIYSFKLHFVQTDSSNVITEDDRKILADLVKKYQ